MSYTKSTVNGIDFHVPQYETRQMVWDSDSKWLTAEASTLVGGMPNLFGRLWQDSIDMGLIVRSSDTGARVVFAVGKEARWDGDITYWTLKPVVVEGVSGAKVADIRLIIYND